MPEMIAPPAMTPAPPSSPGITIVLSFFVTVTLQDALMLWFSLLVAVMVTSPSAMPLTRPFSSTVALVSSELSHVTPRCVVSAGVNFGLS